MAALGSLGVWRHGLVGVTVAGCSVLALTGVIGQADRPEQFEAKQVTVAPSGEDGVRIREVVDQDFGSQDRRGYQRIIPNDFGVPTDVTASSPDAPDDVSVVDLGGETQIRVGDPGITLTGQHRYVLEYTLPDARLSTGELALDIIGTVETLSTRRFEIIVTGLELDDVRCNVGASGLSGGCELRPDGATYRAVIDDLAAGEGITIGARVVGRRDVVNVAEPPLPPRRSEASTVPLALAILPLGAASGAGVYAWSRRRGRNEVFAGGAADAAFGTTPSGTMPPPGTPTPSVRLVADERMGALATIEFVPPKGIEPWQGTVLLRERIDDESVGAWFSGLAARDVVTIQRGGDGDGRSSAGEDITLGVGPKFDAPDSVAPGDATILREMFDGEQQIELGKYDKGFAAAWQAVRAEQQRSIQGSGFWKRQPPGGGGSSRISLSVVVLLVVWVLVGAGSIFTAVLGVFSNPVAALAFGAVVPALAAFAVYRSLLPVRSAAGSAFALRTESFRRFLAASEGRHVEWAWEHGLLREYSAWAVALGAASAWERALASSNVPPAELGTGPLLVYSMGGAFSHTHTAPSSSGGGSGGGFSGGSVGGGGGGGSSGSW